MAVIVGLDTLRRERRGGGGGGGRCFRCGELGHWASACPMRPAAKRRGREEAGEEGKGEEEGRRKKRNATTTTTTTTRKGRGQEDKTQTRRAFEGRGVRLAGNGDGQRVSTAQGFVEAVEQRQWELLACAAAARVERTDTQSDVIDLAEDDDKDKDHGANNNEQHVAPHTRAAVSVTRTISESRRTRAQTLPLKQRIPLGIPEAAGEKARERIEGRSAAAAGTSSSSSYNPYFSGYEPKPLLPSEIQTIQTREIVEAEDYSAAGHFHRCSALLDTGNAGRTLITRALATRLGLFSEPSASSALLRKTMPVHGVVAGASERVPLATFAYRLKGKTVRGVVGITNANLGCDVLISLSDIGLFESDGFIFKSGAS